jgi:hypothetical protein
LGAADYNPKGSWEPINARKLNAGFLHRHGVVGLDPSMRLQEIVLDESEKEDYIGHVRTFLATCPPGPALVIKELAVTELWDLWSEAARRDGFSIKVVIPIRHPQEVTASFRKSVERGSAFWLKRNLLAEQHSRNTPRVFVEYSNLMKDWRTEVARISKALHIQLSGDEAAIDDFLDRDLHRNKCSGPVSEPFPYSWMSRTYTILSNAALDRPIDFATLDEIYGAFRACERTFRVSFDEYQIYADSDAAKRSHEALEHEPILMSGRDF